MALYDNKYWMLSHIRSSFISTDDTGMCELVMTGESKQFKQHLATLEKYPDTEDSQDDDDLESYDIQMDMEMGFRERPNTLGRNDKSDSIAKKKSTKLKTLKWSSKKTVLSQEEKEDLFVKKDLSNLQQLPTESALTKVIEQFTNLPLNPYMEYAKFDGTGQVNIPTRKYRIFLTMLPEAQRNYPISVCCVATAKIQELIGLILLKCSTNQGDYTFKPVSNYGLYITEEDGEVDRDFPSLDSKESVAKFGFTCLGLVEHKDSKNVSFDKMETLTISAPNEDYSKKRTIRESKVEESKQIKNDMQLMAVHNKAMEAPLYQSYQVYIIHKMRARIEILLGISGEKIEIDPVQQKNSMFYLVKQKAVSHHMDTVAWCQITDTKTHRTTFRVIYTHSLPGSSGQFDSSAGYSSNATSQSPLQSSASFKHYDFEAEPAIAVEIVDKINLILDLRSSASRKEYLAAKDRKLYKSKSFHLK